MLMQVQPAHRRHVDVGDQTAVCDMVDERKNAAAEAKAAAQ
jgi:hypothetical protein